MDNKILTAIFGIFVVVIVLASTMIPAIDSFGSTSETITISMLKCTGDNGAGQQGDGTTTDVTEFTQRLDTETIASVACSDNTTAVLKNEIEVIVHDSPYKILLSVCPLLIIATVLFGIAAIIFRNRE